MKFISEWKPISDTAEHNWINNPLPIALSINALLYDLPIYYCLLNCACGDKSSLICLKFFVREYRIAEPLFLSQSSIARLFLSGQKGLSFSNIDMQIGVNSYSDGRRFAKICQGEVRGKKSAGFIGGVEFQSAFRNHLNGQPRPLTLNQRPIKSAVSLPQDGRADDRSDTEERRPDNKPSSEPIYRISLTEPPWLFLERLLLFSTPGGGGGWLAGFIFLFGLHRRPTFGAALYFAGLFMVAAGAALAVG